jgi:hypothetical protein
VPVVRVSPRTPQQQEDARLHQLRFGRWVPPKPKTPTGSTTHWRSPLRALRDLVEATIWRQASAITVPTVGQSSAPPLPPQTPTATPPRTVGQRVRRPPIPLIGG